MNSTILYKLESLRGVAACLVVLFHSSFTYSEASVLFVSNSYLFVDFFFILSGFVMELAYSRKINDGMTFNSYIILRLGRVYPLHFFMLLVFVPYVLMKQYLFNMGFGGTDQYVHNNIPTFLSNLTLIHSMGIHDNLSWNVPSWSICVEFFTYVSFYLLSLSLDKKKNLLTPLVFSVICYCGLISLERPNLDITSDFGFIRCLGAFYIGIFVFRLSKYKRITTNINRNINFYELVIVCLVIVSVTYAEVKPLYFIFTIVTFLLSVLIFSSEKSGVIGRLLNTDILRKIGTWSYSIYMIHWLVLSVSTGFFDVVLKMPMLNLGVMSVLINALNIAIIVLISRFTYVYIENFFRVLTRDFVSNIKTKKALSG